MTDLATLAVPGALLALSGLSTVHTFLGKHPRAQALLASMAHLAGPFNLPAVWRSIVVLARAVVAAEDVRAKAEERAKRPMLSSYWIYPDEPAARTDAEPPPCPPTERSR